MIKEHIATGFFSATALFSIITYLSIRAESIRAKMGTIFYSLCALILLCSISGALYHTALISRGIPEVYLYWLIFSSLVNMMMLISLAGIKFYVDWTNRSGVNLKRRRTDDE